MRNPRTLDAGPLRQRDVAEFLRYQQGVGSGSSWQCHSAGSDTPSCPNAGSIACLLLETIGSKAGPTGGTLLTQTTFVQRLNTNGGSAPADGCSVSTDVGKQTLVPYTADYFFYKADTK